MEAGELEGKINDYFERIVLLSRNAIYSAPAFLVISLYHIRGRVQPNRFPHRYSNFSYNDYNKLH